MAQICDQISPFLFGVQHLIFMTHDSPSRLVDANSEQWVQLVRLFTCARTLSITGVLATGLLRALRSADGGYTTDTTVLPALRALCIWEHMPLDWPLWDAAKSLVSSRGLSCNSIDSEFQVLCPICNTDFTPQQIRAHLVAQHAYERLCSYCYCFKVRYIPYFQDHLRITHPEVTRNDKLISHDSDTFTPIQIDTLADRHSFLCIPPRRTLDH